MIRVSSFVISLFAGILILTGSAQAASKAIKCVQHQLNDLGYNAGPADGSFGRTTFEAGERYRNYMSTTYEGWAQPELTLRNADFWCKQVAAANNNVAKYYAAFLAGDDGSSAGFLTATALTVKSDLQAGVPYPVAIEYNIDGAGQIGIQEACFTWNGEGPYCFPVTLDANRSQVIANLRTGNPNTYTLNGAIRYVVNGKSVLTNWTSVTINVR